MDRVDLTKEQLQRLLTEHARLREENERLRSMLGLPAEEQSAPSPPPPTGAAVTNQSPPEAKIALYRSLFRGREDVYPRRWENKGGKSGYSPACRFEWVAGICSKPHAKCTGCEHLPVTDQVIADHLTGKHTIGVYPLLPDETCWFLAADFDKSTWQTDVSALLDTCDELNVPAAVERSRSGNGAHVWIFFAQPLPAALARNLGATLLTRTMERRYQLGLDSYDRLFPNQDTMPKGGFGNLIALPLQRGPRDQGNSVFVDRAFRPHQDQWAFLSQIRRMSADEVERIVQEAARSNRVLGVQLSLTDEDSELDPWTLPPSGKTPERRIAGALPKTVRLVQGNLIYVEKEGLPAAFINRLLRLAAFQNPEFYQAQKMRMSTFGKPRVIGCAEDLARHVALPRGCMDDLQAVLKEHGIVPTVDDERYAGVPLDVTFQGELLPLQMDAAQAMLAHDIGTFSATTAFGKTVLGAWLIADRKVNTLVLVHRRQLLDQWRERLAAFLGVPLKSIGQIGGGKNKPTGLLDVGVIQSLNRNGTVDDLVAKYGQVIVDECHHLSAFSFEQVLKQVKARHVVGLTATPIRKDGHHPIIMMQCGPIRFRVDAKQQAASRPFDHVVLPRHTEFRLPPESGEIGIQEIYRLLAEDRTRNALIVADVLTALKEGRSPLVLTERTQHLDELAERLRPHVRHIICLRGGMGAKKRRAIAEELAAIPDGEERLLLATGRYVGEGFDDPRLDTLFLALPIAWRGTVQQYAGRLHRAHDQKRIVQVYDYVDAQVPVLARMFEKRQTGYKAIGYSVEKPGAPSVKAPSARQVRLWA